MIILWHNPRCSKSRAALALLRAAGTEPQIRLYLQDPPTAAEIRSALAALGATGPLDLMRPCEPAFRAAGLGPETAPEDLVAAMAANPVLIQRPLALSQGRAVIGRPPEAVLALLG